ncbi:unnamed protein product [Prorocentrum cordatum]|uniref:Uncharacterized protein n=1 Tax=Prorocentrum cordatum TaxID=2364126 RepID=A0ABN9UX70_9DINO|nr:unnamed protein product [Polarella glacialis]
MRADNHGIRFECFHLLVNSFLGAAVVSEATLVEVFEKLAESIDVPVIQAPDGNEVKDALALAAEIQGSFDVVQRPSVSVYYEMPKYDLAVQMVERDNEPTLLQSELKQVKRRLATTEQRLGLHTKKSRILHDTHRSLVQKTNFRPGKRCVSIWSGYHLAYKRSHGCSSARSVVAMCAGEEWQGSFTDGAKNMVIRFEHNLSIARTVVVKSFYDSVNHLHATSNEICINYARAASLDSGDMVALIGGKLFRFEFFMFRGDATNQEAVDKAKVWTGEASYIATCPEALSDISSDTNFDSDDLKLTFFREVLDLQTVRTGGAKETTDLVTRQFRNAGLPTWMEESKIEREHQSEASKQGTAYTGPTFVSKFVSGKAKVILDEFNALLDDDAMLTHWVGTWSLIRADDVPEHVEEALCLIVTLVVRGALDWERRMYDPTQRFPPDFLNVLEADPEEASAPRKALAHRLMTASKENLEWQDGVYNSFSFKLRAMFYEDFFIMQGTGKCTRMVWIFLAGWRALFNGETQEIEGWNSTLKNMCERAPRTKVRLASDRLKNRVGERTPTDEAVAVHEKVVEFSKTDANMFRFSPLTDKYMLSWTSLKAASVIADTAQVTPLFKRAYNGPKKKNTHTVDAEGGLPDMLEDDGGFSEELERLIAQGAMEEECEDLEGASEGLDSDGKDTDVEDDAGDRQPDQHNHAGPDKSDVFDAISGDHRAELLRSVRGACEASRTSARDAMYFAEDYGFRTDISDAPERGLVSLVELRTVAEDGQVHYDVVFVAWEGVGRSAKIARVDLEHLWFKYNVPATEHLKRECDRDHCNIIIGNVPVRVTRPKDLRERVPDWCLLIMKAFAAELFSGPIARDCLFSCDAPCVVCACADTMGMDVRVVGGGGAQPVEHFDSYICSECVVYWHSACAENVARAFGMGSPFEEEGLFVCPICLNE